MGDNHGHPIDQASQGFVQPQPVPTTFNVTQVQATNGDIFAQLTMYTATGVHVVFLDPAVAKAVGEALTKIASLSASGLLMP